jgi:hypothetical protein
MRGPGRGMEGRRQVVGRDAMVDIGWKTQVLAWDLDMRELVSRVQVELAKTYSAMLSTGRQADGRRVPRQHEVTDAIKAEQRSVGRHLGARTMAMAQHYQWGKVSGSTMRARGNVTPFTGAMPGEDKGAAIGRTKWAASAASKGLDLVSNSGAALNAIRDAVSQYMRDAKADAQGRVATKERPSTNRGGLRWGRVPPERQR